MSLHTTGAQYKYKEHQQPHTKVWLPSYWAIHNLLLLLTHSSLRTSAKAPGKVGYLLSYQGVLLLRVSVPDKEVHFGILLPEAPCDLFGNGYGAVPPTGAAGADVEVGFALCGVAGDETYFTLGVGCPGGRHRSVAITEE